MTIYEEPRSSEDEAGDTKPYHRKGAEEETAKLTLPELRQEGEMSLTHLTRAAELMHLVLQNLNNPHYTVRDSEQVQKVIERLTGMAADAREALRSLQEEIREKKTITEIGSASEASALHRTRNDDAVVTLQDAGVIGVFDGLGEHGAFGGHAAQVAAGVFHSYLREIPIQADQKEEERRLGEVTKEVQRRFSSGEESVSRKLKTTAVVAKYIESEEKGYKERSVIVAHAGDSRAYGLTRTGELVPLTLDHGVVARNLDEQNAWDEEPTLPLASRNVTKVLSRDSGALEVHTYPLRNDIVGIICTSDGVHDSLKKSTIEGLLREGAEGATEDRLLIQMKKNVGTIVRRIKQEASDLAGDRYKEDDVTMAWMFFE
jgi:serine/threonine protein phosphatase PrpC